jgi:hypothetical protein
MKNDLMLLFNRFKGDDGTIGYTDLKRILNILFMDINGIDFKERYTYDEFMSIINDSKCNFDCEITKKQFTAKLKGHFDNETIAYITNAVFKDTDKVKMSDVKLSI